MSSNENIILIAGIGIVFLGFIYLSSKKDDNKNITTLSNGETFKWNSTPLTIQPSQEKIDFMMNQMKKDGFKIVTMSDGSKQWVKG